MIDVVVVGAGVFGLSVGLELTRRGRTVQFVSAGTPGRVGASAAQARVARLAHGRDAVLTQSAIDSLAAWRQLERLCGARLFEPTGVVHLLALGGDSAWELDSAATLASFGSVTREVDRAELAQLFPALSTDGLAGALLECDGGILLARAATVALHQLAQDAGAQTVIGTARPVDAGVEVGGDRILASTVVWAVGAALPSVFPTLPGIRARVHDSDVFAYCDPSLRVMPAWMDRSAPAYGVPGGAGELMFALDVDRSPGEPPQPDLAEAAQSYVAARFPAAGLRRIRQETCGYASTADDDFVVGRVPGSTRHWIVGGDSGHGFKHALSFGRHAARAIQGEAGPPARFALERLRDEHASLG